MERLLIVILHQLEHLPPLLEAWQAIGVSGITILESAGAHRTRTWLSHMGLEALDRLFEAPEVRNRLLLTAIEDEQVLQRAIAEAERIVGGFDKPDSGVLLVLPVVQAKGLHKLAPPPTAEVPPPAIQTEWVVHRNTPVEEAAAVLNLKPTLVPPDMPLEEVARIMVTSPNVHVACVVGEDGRLLGLLGLRRLADNLFFHIMPEEFMSEITDLEHMMDYARMSSLRTAGDAMEEPIWVKEGETVKDAFKRMHEHRLSGLPIVNDQYQVVGYVNLLELLAICLPAPTDKPDAEAGT